MAEAPCIRCGTEKFRNARGKLYCKACAARQVQAWRRDNSEAVHAAQRARYERDRELYLPRFRANYRANRDARNVATREWQLANPDKVRQYKRSWVEKNPERGRVYAAKRRALKAEAVCEHGPKCVPFDTYALIAGQMCVYCAAAAEHADHYVPLARGGKHCRANLVPACARCNRSKGARLADEWVSALREEVA